MFTSQWLLCIHCLYATCEFQGFYTEDESSREREKVKLFSSSETNDNKKCNTNQQMVKKNP